MTVKTLVVGQSLADLIDGLQLGQLGPWVVLATLTAFAVAVGRYLCIHAATRLKPSDAKRQGKMRGGKPRSQSRKSTGPRRIVGAPSGSLIVKDE